MKYRLIFIFVILAAIRLGYSQEKGVFEGIVKNKESGETLIGAHVVLKNDRSFGTVTNVNGEYSLPLKPGRYTFLISYTNMQNDTLSVSIKAGETVYKVIELLEYVAVFDEIEIKTEKF